MVEYWHSLSNVNKIKFVLSIILGILGVVFATLNWTEQEVHLLVTKMKMPDRKSTRLNSSHITISYAVFCLKKKKRQCSSKSKINIKKKKKKKHEKKKRK